MLGEWCNPSCIYVPLVWAIGIIVGLLAVAGVLGKLRRN